MKNEKINSFTERVSIGSYLVFNIPMLFFIGMFSVIFFTKEDGGSEYLLIAFVGISIVVNLMMFGQKITATRETISHRNSFFKSTAFKLKTEKPKIELSSSASINGMEMAPRIHIFTNEKHVSINAKGFSRGLFPKLKKHIQENS